MQKGGNCCCCKQHVCHELWLFDNNKRIIRGRSPSFNILGGVMYHKVTPPEADLGLASHELRKFVVARMKSILCCGVAIVGVAVPYHIVAT